MSISQHQQLLKDLDALYTSIVVSNTKNGILMSRMQICEKIANSPAPRLYISPERARFLTFNYHRYRAKKYKAIGKHAEFYRRYCALPPEQRSMQNIIKILEQPAPSFYLSAEYISRILYRIYDRRE